MATVRPLACRPVSLYASCSCAGVRPVDGGVVDAGATPLSFTSLIALQTAVWAAVVAEQTLAACLPAVYGVGTAPVWADALAIAAVAPTTANAPALRAETRIRCLNWTPRCWAGLRVGSRSASGRRPA